jgi:hypothetical protein
MWDLVGLIQRHGLLPHLFADDTQVYGMCRPSKTLLGRLYGFMDDIAGWMASNCLQLNSGKSELLWCHTPVAPVASFRFASVLTSSRRQPSFVIWAYT